MAISARAAGAWSYVASGNITPSLPTHQAGDMLLVRVAYKSSAIATCSASSNTAGWTKLGEYHDGTTNSGNGTGSVAVAHFWKVATSAAETNPSITFSQAVTQVGASAVSFQKGAAEAWLDPVGDGGGFATGAPISATIQTHISVVAGDMVVFFLGSRDDTAFTNPTITQTGVTFDTVTEYPATAGLDGSGADGSYDAGYRLATAGTSSAAAVVTATIATETGSAWMTRLRVASGTVIYPTSTASAVVTAADDKEAWTTRGGSALSAYVDTVAGPTAPIYVGTAGGGAELVWYTRPLAAFTLSGATIGNIRASEFGAATNATVGVEIARVESDGSSASVWGTATLGAEVATSQTAYRLQVSGSDLAISNGQRIRIRFYFDDATALNMGGPLSFEARIYYNGPTADASGDTYLTFSQALTESSNDKSGSGALSTSASFASAGTKAGAGSGSLTPTATFARAGAKAGAGAGGALTLTATLAGVGNAAEAHSGSGSLSLSASLASSATKAGAGTGSLSISASLSSAGAKTGAGAATLPLSATLASAGQKAFEATGSLTLSATLARAGQKGGQDSGAISLTLGFAATGGPSAEAHSGSGTLSLSATLASSATKAGAGTGTVSLTASLARAGAKTGKGAGALTLAPSFSSAGNEAAQSSGALALAPTFSRSGTKAGAGAGTVALSVALSGSGSGPVAASGSGTLELTLTFTANGKAGRPGGYVPYEPALPYIPRIAKRGSGRLRLYVGLAGNGHKTGATGHGELVAVLGATSRATKAVAGAGEALEPYLVAWGVGYGEGDTVRALRAELARAYVRIAQLEAEVEALEALVAVA